MTRSVFEDITDDVRPHSERFLACGLTVVVHVGVLPSVAQVALPGEEAHQASFVDEAIAFWGMVVVFVYLGQAVGEVVFLVVDGVAEGELDEVQLGEDAFHLRHDKLAQAVVVVDVQEAAADKIVTEVLRLTVAEDHVAVTRHVEHGVVEQFGAAHVDGGILRVEPHLLVLVAEGDEVGERGGVGIPITATAVLQQGYLGLGSNLTPDPSPRERGVVSNNIRSILFIVIVL